MLIAGWLLTNTGTLMITSLIAQWIIFAQSQSIYAIL